jgi:sec-independent protein translocase protein TatC
MNDSSEENHDEDMEQPLVDHLIELRQRLLYSVFCVLMVFLGLLIFSFDIYGYFIQPIVAVLPEGGTLLATGTISPFLTPFKLTFYVAIYASVPFLLHQAWLFVSPGLYKNEKRVALPLFLGSVVLFYSGIAFAYFVVLPAIFYFMAAIELPGVSYMPDIAENLSLVLKLFFAFGLAFEIPVVTILLIMSGAVSPDSLASKRPYIFVGCFILGMLLTPPDIISQFMLALPMWLLFEAGVFFGRMLHRPS